jgi:hypothetical protein
LMAAIASNCLKPLAEDTIAFGNNPAKLIQFGQNSRRPIIRVGM